MFPMGSPRGPHGTLRGRVRRATAPWGSSPPPPQWIPMGPHGVPMWTPWVPWGPHEVPWGPHGVPMTFSPLIILMPAAAMPTPRSRSSSPNPPLSYHPRWCCTCQCWFNGQVQYQDHKQGRRHQRKLLKLPPPP